MSITLRKRAFRAQLHHLGEAIRYIPAGGMAKDIRAVIGRGVERYGPNDEIAHYQASIAVAMEDVASPKTDDVIEVIETGERYRATTFTDNGVFHRILAL